MRLPESSGLPRYDAQAAYLKGLTLLLYADATETGVAPPAKDSLIEELRAALEQTGLPTPVRILLIDRYLREGRYAKAEDVLFDQLDRQTAAPELIRRGLMMYEQLATLSDSELRAGNLPRTEVDAGWAELKTLGQIP